MSCCTQVALQIPPTQYVKPQVDQDSKASSPASRRKQDWWVSLSCTSSAWYRSARQQSRELWKTSDLRAFKLCPVGAEKILKAVKNRGLANGMSSLSIAVVMSVLVWGIVACSRSSQATSHRRSRTFTRASVLQRVSQRVSQRVFLVAGCCFRMRSRLWFATSTSSIPGRTWYLLCDVVCTCPLE